MGTAHIHQPLRELRSHINQGFRHRKRNPLLSRHIAPVLNVAVEEHNVSPRLINVVREHPPQDAPRTPEIGPGRQHPPDQIVLRFRQRDFRGLGDVAQLRSDALPGKGVGNKLPVQVIIYNW